MNQTPEDRRERGEYIAPKEYPDLADCAEFQEYARKQRAITLSYSFNENAVALMAEKYRRFRAAKVAREKFNRSPEGILRTVGAIIAVTVGVLWFVWLFFAMM